MTALRSAALAMAFVAGAAIAGASVEQPRPFGHFLGDLLPQRIELGDAANDPPYLPPADRVATWFERRAARIEVAADGRRWLVIDYQIINAPATLARVVLPGLTVTMKDKSLRRALDWPLTLSPMTMADTANTEDPGLQADRAIASLPTDVTRRRLWGCAALLTVTVGGWLLWLLWCNRRDAATLPFATAWRTLRRRGADGSADEEWIALHRALNATAGRVLHAESLPGFLREQPALQLLGPDLEEFFRQSNQRFFSTAPAVTPLSLLELCRKLRRLERRGATGP